ncbi:pyridoxamine 5'-phosphate oxidase family protein [Amycolatopsis jiangsuensis]|uniref:Nitroimidazol reductase NimA-like FMN-containing flavoprotein (Pyridoxamine 5'-phosphate oxidase superfamily) n=1 Tax=Amycolatopsis jiangsuensis TaxID=1181879 RepID=A0A840J230_9PSEU|nr:pyridoxamine 5'-phosphate oxidase family protein [Amycolatopsis jiangsuensis]MBB4687468.1 nitroimidazol reductase NimA-like FMN-containing flavoprotein (pyridoxamine 5'-phosphate oxidase superfamily) [Amycolatopsis jiangsuensis]
MSRRDQIRMTPDEVQAFFAAQKVINVASIGPDNRPHLAPLWYYPHEGGVATWTYGSSQKAKNLRRLPEATVLIESGDSYEQLRGVSFEAAVEFVEDTEQVTRMGIALMQRYAGAAPDDPAPAELQAFIAGQAPKRVGLIMRPTKIASWDHRKLAGVY